MKVPRFTLGMITGILLSILSATAVYNFWYITTPNGYYESPIIPFYVTESSPHYPEYQRLQSSEYWNYLANSAGSSAEEYCSQRGCSVDVSVHCVGSPQGYSISFAVGGDMSIRQLIKSEEVRTVIIDYIDTAYQQSLDLITKSAEQDVAPDG